MKKIVGISAIVALAINGLYGASNSELLSKLSALENEINNIKKELNTTKNTLTEVKKHDGMDNLKWTVDLRNSIDNIEYKMADGSKRSNHSLLSTRLWLNMVYSPNGSDVFSGILSYNKAYGADMGNARGFGMDRFDWITNETLTGNDLKVKEAYWLHKGKKLFGKDIPWTFSVGRRPSTNGFLANLREDDKAKSPLGHNINVEFDGVSALVNLENLIGIPGFSFKLCAGQGSTNAKPRFNPTGTDYDKDSNVLDDSKLFGFIFTPYDDGQITVKTTAFRAWDMPGYSESELGQAMMNPTYNPSMSVRGDMDGAAISVLVDGLTDDGIFEDTKLFASYAWSKTRPKNGATMLGSTESKTGTSYWFGIQQPFFDDKLKVGIEYNHGSKYWRPFTYGEDTMIGSKLAVRGNAFEVYFTYEINDALSFQLRYTKINYDYTGSNGFFGASGTPIKISDLKAAAAAGDPQAQAMLPNVVESAQDIRAYIRYRF